MSYSRWGQSKWYTYWMCQDPTTENRETAIFNICAIASFTAKQLRTDIKQCLNVAMNKEFGDSIRVAEREELRGYIEEFLTAVDEKYPNTKL